MTTAKRFVDPSVPSVLIPTVPLIQVRELDHQGRKELLQASSTSPSVSACTCSARDTAEFMEVLALLGTAVDLLPVESDPDFHPAT